VTPVSRDVLAAMAETVSPQGVIGVAPLLDVPLERALQGGARLVAVLEAVNDPGNAGTVIRTADAAGADAVVLTDGSTDPHGGKCVRATAGQPVAPARSCPERRWRRRSRRCGPPACRCWPPPGGGARPGRAAGPRRADRADRLAVRAARPPG
jgi:hypothetical protein